jgi:hypothetical protein
MVQFLVLIDMVELKLAYKLMDLHIFTEPFGQKSFCITKCNMLLLCVHGQNQLFVDWLFIMII